MNALLPRLPRVLRVQSWPWGVAGGGGGRGDSLPEVWCSPSPHHLSASQEVTHFPRSRKGCEGYNVHPYWQLGSQDAQDFTFRHLSLRSFSARRVGKGIRGRGHLSTTLATLRPCRPASTLLFLLGIRSGNGPRGLATCLVISTLLFLLGIRSGNGPRGLATCRAPLPLIPVLRP